MKTIKQIKGIDGRERVLLPLETLAMWCRKYYEKHGLKLPDNFIIEIRLSENTVCSYENFEQDNKL
jgi:hypothetical protein